MNIESELFKILESNPSRTYKPKELARLIDIPSHNYHSLKRTLKNLIAEGRIYKFKKGRIGIGKKPSEVVGRLQVKAQGYGFLIQDNNNRDIYLNQINMGIALDGDLVRVVLFDHTKGKSTEGRVVEILERARKNIVGTYQAFKYWGTVIPDNWKLQRDIYIPIEKSKHAQSGQKVVVRLFDWEDEHFNLEGEIVEILGYPQDKGIDILSIAKAYDLSDHFSTKTYQETKLIGREIDEAELRKRIDLRDELSFTIDPEDSKDFDDAVSLKMLDNSHYLLGVHIADVSHYVLPNTSINKEAMERGTSVYLVDRVIPMLPEVLSNDICCLKPDQDRLCISILMELSSDSDLIRYDIQESVMQSKHRFTYEEVQKIIEAPKKDKKFAETIRLMYLLSKKLIEKRKQRGGLDFGSREVKIELNGNGEPVRIQREVQLDSHRIIEEFMVLANNTIASHIAQYLKIQTNQVLPFAYRVHEKPSREKLKDFNKFLAALGIDFPITRRVTPKRFQQLLGEIKNPDMQILIEEVMVRTMMKAKYDIKNIGHFGLALTNYCHFTSPIRRYPDLICHRLLKQYLLDPLQIQMKRNELEKICQIATEREIVAQEAERASIKAKQIEFMEHHIGETFNGIISGVVSYGIFVEIMENLVEGLVHITNLPHDYYVYDEQRFCLFGERKGRIFQLGNRVRIRVIQVNHEAQLIDFELIENNHR